MMSQSAVTIEPTASVESNVLHEPISPVSSRVLDESGRVPNMSERVSESESLVPDDVGGSPAGTSDVNSDELMALTRSIHEDGSDESIEDPPDLDMAKRPCRLPMKFRDYHLYSCEVMPDGDPPTLKEALKGEHSDRWKAAVTDELESLKRHNVYELVDRPPNVNVVQSKWVRKTKDEPEGKRFRARLVARGFSQRKGVDYLETFRLL